MIHFLESFANDLYATTIAVAVRENDLLFPSIEAVHVLAITLVVGSIGVVDLRLLNIGWRSRSILEFLREVLPLTWIAFGLALLTGTTLFASNAPTYLHNGPFQFKMGLLVLAGLNILTFHAVTARKLARSGEVAGSPAAARFAGAVSLLMWIGIVCFGRWIGFTTGS